ncbi:hypothetical protein Amsp01_104940 [Amycolatopsis sp. NBRC 101858]|uniref:hypothetical protein n=1 Tax=Amycolatopsis sp. NBRC 101858 TaxID=3032200 RepID=UPI0024A53AE3|nr:hypothetical protein [Amycolatopsis sp. NBRC 101858]GLY44471.1 hypothetical protein Amsp01_104940 [Amycolatopsis sp. NBRC 101858]
MNQHPPDSAAVLRTELAAGEAASVAHRAPRTQARRRRLWPGVAVAAVVAVVVAGGGAALVMASSGDEAPAQPVAVAQWPARGPLAGDTALVDRAKLAWANASPAGAPGSEAAVLYAGPLGRQAGQNVTLVVLRRDDAAGRTSLGFMTTPSTTGAPDTATLMVRAQVAVSTSGPAPAAYGFVVSRSAPGAPGSWAVALAAPGMPTARFGTSVVEHGIAGTAAPSLDGLLTVDLPPQAAAWNTGLAFGDRGERGIASLVAAAGDPATRTVTATPRLDGTFTVTGAADAQPGDLLTLHDGLIGVVTTGGATAGAGTDLTTLRTSGLSSRTATADRPVGLAAGPGRLSTVTAGPGVLHEGDRIVAGGFPGTAALINLGTVHLTPDGTWILRRDVWFPVTPTRATLIRHP